MLRYLIPLVVSWLPIWTEYLVYFVAGTFVAVVGALIHSFFRR